MADIICRWRNATPKTICEIVEKLPKQEMPSEKFRIIIENNFPGFLHTPYQLACRLALYYEDDGKYYPRFHENISEEYAKNYLSYWIMRYYAPNPYTKSLKTQQEPVYLIEELVKCLEKNNGSFDLKQALTDVYKEPMGNLDIVQNIIDSYSHVIKINNGMATLSNDYKIYMETISNRNDRKAFFDNFNFEEGKNILSTSLQTIFYGAPGTGKSRCIKDNPDVKAAEAKGNVFRTTFHPDSDYSTFVGAYKPTMKSVADKYKAVAGKDEEITYSFVPQAFLQAYIAAWKQPEENVYLVIEEINRGNCAQIFGDLFQLLDRDCNGESEYPIMADNDLRAFLERDENLGKDSEGIRGGKLKLPKNLHILATMNTSDQSLFPIDSAFKRRWEWKYMKIVNMTEELAAKGQKAYQIEVNDKRYDWWRFVEKMNDIIGEATASEDKKMGYFFCKPNLPDNGISAEQFVSKALFYIFGDALKDYPIKDEAFKKSEKDGKTLYYEFSDFYDWKGDVNENVVAAVLDKFVGEAEEKKQVETQ